MEPHRPRDPEPSRRRITTKYALLLDQSESTASEDEDLAPWHDYTRAWIGGRGTPGGEALQPTPTATTVRLENSRVSTADGPFAETREESARAYRAALERVSHVRPPPEGVPERYRKTMDQLAGRGV